MNINDIHGLKFKHEFFKLVERYPSEIGYFLQSKIPEFEDNHYPKKDATHQTLEELCEDIKKFVEKYPDSTILCADDPGSLLIGYVIYTVIDNQEISRYYTISIKNAKNAKETIKEMFRNFKNNL